jgi:hypothetical protein
MQKETIIFCLCTHCGLLISKYNFVRSPLYIIRTGGTQFCVCLECHCVVKEITLSEDYIDYEKEKYLTKEEMVEILI